MSATARQQDVEARLLRVLAYIHDNLDGDLSLDTLSDIACMSRFHWHRVFSAMTGETLADAVRRIRLLKAANALVQETGSIAEIAGRHGYPNLASFSRAFNAALGASPGEFRERGVQQANDLRRNPGANTMYPVTLKDLAPSRAAGVPHLGPYPELAKAFQQLGGILAARNLFAQARGLFAIYHDAPESKPAADLRAHVAVLIGDDFPAGIQGLEYFDLAGGRHAILEHKGPYATLGSAYEWLYGKWLPLSGEEPRDGPPVELYLNDPRNTPPDQLRTDIRLPLA
jgi:AraC family transcriptional regulator